MQNLINKEFGLLKVLERSERTTPSGQILYTVQCSCGNRVDVFGYQLRSGKKTHCGCQNPDYKKVHYARKRQKHQASHTPTYGSFDNMLQRTLNPNAPNYPEYGGRGIKVCDRWKESYQNFVEDMGERPLHHTLDRIDPNGDYTPENCRWSPTKVQNMNRRRPSLVRRMKAYKGFINPKPKPKSGDKGEE